MEGKKNNKNVLSLHYFFRLFFGYNCTKQEALQDLKEVLQKSSVAENDEDSSMDYIIFKNGSDNFKLKCNTLTDKRSNNFINSEDDKSTNKRTESDHIREVIYTKFCKDNFTEIQKISDFFERHKYFTLSSDSYKFIDDFCKNVSDNEENTREFINFITDLNNDYLKSAWIFAFLCFPKAPSEKNTNYRILLLKKLLQSQHMKKDFHPLDITHNNKQIEKINNDNIGRIEEIEEIKREMLSNNTVLVYGIGGIGKSYICRKLFWNYYYSFSDGIEYLAWIQYNSNLAQSITISFYEAETNLDNIRKKYDNHPVIRDMFVKLALTEKPEDKLQVIKELFNKLDNRLLVFIDNADTMTKDEKKWLNTCKCRMIITSRQKIDGFYNVNINSPSPEYCKEMYVCEIWENSRDTYSLDDEKYINKITELANYHTQTIMLIAKAQICLGLSSEEMLEELNNTGFVLKGYDEIIDTEEYELTMAEHLTKIFNLLNVSDETQLRTIRLFSLLAPNTSIKKHNIKKWFELSSLTSINELVKYGWLNSSGSEYVSIHPIIADVVRYNYKPDFEYATPLINAFQEEMKAADDYIKRNAIIVHCAAIATIFENSDEESYAVFLSNTAVILHDTTSYIKSIDYNKKALSIFEKNLEVEYVNFASTCQNLASVYSDLGRYNDSISYYNKSISIHEQFFDTNNYSEITKAYNGIARVYYNSNEYNKALEFYYKILDFYKKVLSMKKTLTTSDYREVAITYNGIANVYCDLRNYNKSLELYRDALYIKENELGLENASTANTYNDIAIVYRKLKQYDLAMDYYKKAIAIHEKIYGTEHTYTAIIYHGIAGVYNSIGDNENALTFYKKSIKIFEKKLGKSHNYTTSTYISIAMIYDELGQHDKSLIFYNDALIYLESRNEEGSYAATVYSHIALIYYRKDEYEHFLNYYNKALEIRKKNLGVEHPDTAATYYNIATIYDTKRDYNKALTYYNKTLDIEEKVLGSEHPVTIKTKNQMEEIQKLLSENE